MVKSAGANASDFRRQASLILTDLPLDGAHRRVNGREHRVGVGLGAENGAAGAYGDLDLDLRALLFLEADGGLGVRVEIAVQLTDLFLGVGEDLVRLGRLLVDK